MNSKFVNFAVKSVSAVATAVVLLVSNPATSFANSVHEKKQNQPIDAQVSVKYTGSNSKLVAFRLTFENVNGERFWLIIKNDAGEVVFEDQFTDAHFDRNIYLDVEATQIRPTFVIRTADQEVERSVPVNKKFAEDGVSVSRP
jgi:hypothetical protein